MFPDFGERTVEISHCDEIFTVPKLSISQYSQAIKIINEVDSQMPATVISDRACKNLWLLLETILPEKILCDRGLFAYNDLVEFCLYLAFGSYLDNKGREHKRKYYEAPALPDYQFKAARILSRFSAYTLEKLLNEPASIFFALSDYADRITADHALELVAAGLKAAFSNFDQLNAKRGSMTILNPNCTQGDILLEEKQETEAFLENYQK